MILASYHPLTIVSNGYRYENHFQDHDTDGMILFICYGMEDTLSFNYIYTWISLNPNAFPIAVAVKSLPPLPNVVIAPDFWPWKSDMMTTKRDQHRKTI